MENESDAARGTRTIRVGVSAEVLREFATGLDLQRQLLGPLGRRAYPTRRGHRATRWHESPRRSR